MGVDDSTVFVRNLPFGITQESIEKIFGEVGPIRKVSVIKNRGSSKQESHTRGFAFVKFALQTDTASAIEKFNNSEVDGRKIYVELAKKKSKDGKKTRSEEENTSASYDIKQEPGVALREESTEVKKEVKQEVIEPSTKRVSDKKKGSKQTAAQGEDHTQSERNARRRKHRELLRKVKEKAEATATTEEKTLIIYGLSDKITQKQLYKRIRKTGNVVKVELSADSKGKSGALMGKAMFETLKDADNAHAKLDKHVFKGCTMTVRRLRNAAQHIKGVTQNRNDAQCRLIIRNLNFEVVEEDLQKAFEEFGPIDEVRVARMPVEDPVVVKEEGESEIKEEEQNDDNDNQRSNEDQSDVVQKTQPIAKKLGRSRGFGFVQFCDLSDAQKALEKMNGQKLKGRVVAVDFCVSKSEYLKAQDQSQQENKDEDDEENENDDDGDDDDDDVKVEENDNEGEDDENDDENDDDDENENENENDDNDDNDDNDNENSEEKVKRFQDEAEDMERTLFLRNVSYDTTENDLREFFTKYGPIDYAKVVMDHGSGLSKGVAFVRMRDVEVSRRIIKIANEGLEAENSKKKESGSNQVFYNEAKLEGNGIILDGRMLSISKCVSKSDASNLADENRVKRERDRRNLYLQHEGYVKVEELESGETSIPTVDVEKRKRAIKDKKLKLKNPLFFISPTRLSVRNLHHSIGNNDLKSLFLKAARAGLKKNLVAEEEVKKEFRLPFSSSNQVDVKIFMAKVIRDLETKDEKSRGYGFVEFDQHVHALCALREVNNNPEYSEYTMQGKKNKNKQLKEHLMSRVIVEFAVENHAKLQLREKRLKGQEKFMKEQKALEEAQGGDEHGDAEEKKKTKKSRGQRQREKKRSHREGNDEEEGSTDTAKRTKRDHVAIDVEKKSKKRALEGTNNNTDSTSTVTKSSSKKGEEGRGKKRRGAEDHQSAEKDSTEHKKEKKSKSRRQSKHEKELELPQEKKFDSMVANYKKQLFGAGAKKASQRWFD